MVSKTASLEAQTGELSPKKRGRKRIYADQAAKQKAYRARQRAKRPVQPRSKPTLQERIVAVCREHNDYRGIFLTDAPKGKGKLIYMGGVGAHDQTAEICDRNQVRELIGGSRVSPEGAGPDGDGYEAPSRPFKVRLTDGPSPKRNRAFELIDSKVQRMWEYQVYWSLRSPLEERALSIAWLSQRGFDFSGAELTRQWDKKQRTASPTDTRRETQRETLVDEVDGEFRNGVLVSEHGAPGSP